MSALRRVPRGPSLEVVASEADSEMVRLEGSVLRLGRGPDSDIRLQENHVSRRHAEILRRGKHFVIVDLGSKAGVFVNGEQVSERTLTEGDVITLGSVDLPRLVFRASDAPAPAAAAPRHGGARVAAGAPPAPAPAGDAVPHQDTAPITTTLTSSSVGQNLDHLARFLEFSRLLGQRFTLAEILDRVVDLALDLTAAERGFLILSRPDGSLDYRADRRPGEAHGAAGASRADGQRASETIVRDVLTRGRTRVVSDVRGEIDLIDQKSVVALGLRSAVAMPLRRFAVSEEDRPDARPEGEVFGVLYLDSQNPRRPLTTIDAGLLESLARDASAVIENARLLREAEEKRRMQEEVDRARQFQAALLPSTFWAQPHFDVAGAWEPALHLGGDYLDQIRLPGDRCLFLIADVAGKGMPSALLAAALEGALVSEGLREQPLDAMVANVNRTLCRIAPAGKFVTFFCGVLSPGGDLAYVNAGHMPPLIVGAGGAVRALPIGDLAIGIMDTARYREGSLRLDRGDRVVLYTDGVTEAADPGENFFEEERLRDVLRASHRLPPDGIVAAIRAAVAEFSGGLPQRDDIALLVFRYLGPGGGARRGGGDEA